MREILCPNYNTCKFIKTNHSPDQTRQKDHYFHNYCNSTNCSFETCVRYKTKKALGFCPDFVKPDSTLSLDEILDKFDEEEINH